MARVTTMAVNMEVKIPMESVTAKPLTGPVPIEYKIMALNELIKKINILILGAINRKNKRILKMYIYKKYIWSEYYFNIKS